MMQWGCLMWKGEKQMMILQSVSLKEGKELWGGGDVDMGNRPSFPLAKFLPSHSRTTSIVLGIVVSSQGEIG